MTTVHARTPSPRTGAFAHRSRGDGAQSTGSASPSPPDSPAPSSMSSQCDAGAGLVGWEQGDEGEEEGTPRSVERSGGEGALRCSLAFLCGTRRGNCTAVHVWDSHFHPTHSHFRPPGVNALRDSVACSVPDRFSTMYIHIHVHCRQVDRRSQSSKITFLIDCNDEK